MNFLLGNLDIPAGSQIMAKTREAPFETKREERRKNRHGIVVEEMALRPVNSRLLSSQPRNSAYFQLNLLIIAPPLWNSSSPTRRLLFIRSVQSPARGGHYTASFSRYLFVSFVIYQCGASRGMHESRSFSFLGSIMPPLPSLIGSLVIFIVIKCLFYPFIGTKDR